MNLLCPVVLDSPLALEQSTKLSLKAFVTWCLNEIRSGTYSRETTLQLLDLAWGAQQALLRLRQQENSLTFHH